MECKYSVIYYKVQMKIVFCSSEVGSPRSEIRARRIKQNPRNFLPHTSDIRHPTSDIRLHTSNLIPPDLLISVKPNTVSTSNNNNFTIFGRNILNYIYEL